MKCSVKLSKFFMINFLKHQRLELMSGRIFAVTWPVGSRFSNVLGGWIAGQYSGWTLSRMLLLCSYSCSSYPYLPVNISLFFCVQCLVKRSQAVFKINARHWEGLFQTKTKKYRPFVHVGQMLWLTFQCCSNYNRTFIILVSLQLEFERIILI